MPVAAFCRSSGISLSVYLDDFCFETRIRFTSKMLRCLGFDISGKSDLEPKQVVKFLGFFLDSVQMKVFIPHDKLERFCEMVSSALKLGEISLQRLSSAIGQMNSFS
jgi:hypothetical protein